ncbi:hypothetical protein ACQI4L_09180 [Mycolicibacterium litorale]|uniref:hypothetical protein n=1 Tax=Mycolicibacterium litorale TaxID=758802 RepID=UPI003CFB91C4
MTATIERPNTEIPRDRFGRPMVMPPGRGKRRVAYRRATTFVGCLDDMNGLMKWKARQVALGMGQRKDLVLAAAAANPDDKKLLGEIAEKATEHALSSAGATTGTALHSLTERVDRGQQLGYVPVEYEADIKAYEKATAGIEFIGIEAFRVHDDWKVAGTADRIGRLHGRTMIFDIKTGSIDYPHKMAMQLAMYAHSIPYDIPTDTRGEDPERVDPNRGIIIHLPAGEGRCDLYEIDISKGWGACLLARQVWDWRGTKSLTALIDPHEVPKKPPTWFSLAEDATTVDELRIIWTRAKECGDLTPELKAVLKDRNAALRGVA